MYIYIYIYIYIYSTGFRLTCGPESASCLELAPGSFQTIPGVGCPEFEVESSPRNPGSPYMIPDLQDFHNTFPTLYDPKKV